jgi:hypothetical protein
MPKDAAYYRAYRLRRLAEGKPVDSGRKDTRGNRHRPYNPNAKKYKTKSKWERRVVVAWDGEGANLANGMHVYNLLANSSGNFIIEHEGLGTEQVFEFFFTNSNPADINVIFGGSYDINMILVDLPKETLRELWVDGWTVWKDYRIMWANRKKFSVHRVAGKKITQTFVLWDVLGYFQMTFVKACRLWLGDLPILDEIEHMKAQRSVFRVEDIEDIILYNKRECDLLVLLCNALFDSLEEAGISLVRYDGAGSIAAAMLRKHGIKYYKGEIPYHINKLAQCAYSGGRIEAVKIGVKEGYVERSDINSAYPSAALTLPSYREAEWERSETWDGNDHSLVTVQWHIGKERPFYPLWYRDKSGSITYPRNGVGTYWGIEVHNLIDYYEEGEDYVIQEVWTPKLVDKTKPFAFIRDLYDIRRAFAEKGSMASESLKLGLNSIYGKLVQQAGWRIGNQRIPTYHQLLWGGYITASMRAKLYRAAMQCPGHVIAFATDAVFSARHIDVPNSKALGEWTQDEFKGMTIVQAGVYWLKKPDPQCDLEHAHEDECYWTEKYRGFDKGSLDRKGIIEAWRNGTKFTASLTRFIGLGSALARKDFSIWRTWLAQEKELDVMPTGKRVVGKDRAYCHRLCPTRPAPNITPDIPSTPYALAWDGNVTYTEPLVDGIPVRILEDEYEDSYE